MEVVSSVGSRSSADDFMISNSPVNEELSDEIQPKKKKSKQCGRKPSFRPKFMPGMRIIRNDIRRRYGEMWINVMNGYECDLIQRFFYQYCAPHVAFEQYHDEKSTYIKSVYSKAATVGIPSLVAGMIGITKIFADGVARLHNFEVKVTQGVPGCRLMGLMTYKGTMMYSTHRAPMISNSSESNSSQESSALPSQSFAFDDVTSNETVFLSLLPNPVPICMTQLLEMRLDDSHNITLFRLIPYRA